MNLAPLLEAGLALLPSIVDAILPNQNNTNKDLVVAIIELVLSGETNSLDILAILSEAFVGVLAWDGMDATAKGNVANAISVLSAFILSLPNARQRRRIKRLRRKQKKLTRKD